MKFIFLSAFLIFHVQYNVSAQKNQPPIGIIEKADMELRDCEFDKDAEAFKLIDWGSVKYTGGGWNPSVFTTEYERRVRIKILKEKGLKYANVVIPYLAYDGYEKILKVDAYTFNMDNAGNIKTAKVDKSSIYRKKIDIGISKLIIVFPEVKAGSVIEFKYKMERGGASYINDWNFQDDIPVRYSEYQTELPAFLEFKENVLTTDKIAFSKAESKDYSFGESIRKTYSLQNIKGLKEEPFMGAKKDYRQRIEFLLTQVQVESNYVVDVRTAWSQVVNDLMKTEYFGLQIDKFLPQTFDLINQWKNIPDLETRIKTIFKYVQQYMTWNERETILTYDGVKEAYENKTGSTADINLILINLLVQADIKASPILFSTRKHGIVNTLYPMLEQFNTVMVYVPAGNKYLVLDATDKMSDYKLVPAEVVNTNGFLVQGEGGKWIKVLEEKNRYKIFTAIRCDIDLNGKMTGEATVNCGGYAKKDRCKSWLKNREEYKKTYFSENSISLHVEDIITNNVYADSLPLEQKIKFSSVLNSSGDYIYLLVNLFSELEKNPFITEQRIADIDYGYLQNYIIVGNYRIPQEYSFDALPENISLQMPDKSIVFNRHLTVEGNLLQVRLTLDYKNSYYAVADYSDFREFHKKLFEALNEQVVIKKK